MDCLFAFSNLFEFYLSLNFNSSLCISFLGTSGSTSKCFGDLGCLEISENWYGITRPINVLPQEREVINTQFILRTRDTINNVSLIIIEKS